ncbi:uncharacterized protein AB675_4297 [Cyphellophora attinorum]|uniref:F-box domain-containing protein n=1 Tax=Cyphellophora attinorum TaxID=1664694 RepID=A0A0N1H728_9EURO|nr:uncharacterized protein AB675_4297 [Phialophora attinorum]KPI38666.1 hypothetical protein AB675_4297 [Phialophora attinorum]
MTTPSGHLAAMHSSDIGTSTESGKTIHDLPQEVLDQIFESLDSRSVKSARIAHRIFYIAGSSILFQRLTLTSLNACEIRDVFLNNPNGQALASCVKTLEFYLDGPTVACSSVRCYCLVTNDDGYSVTSPPPPASLQITYGGPEFAQLCAWLHNVRTVNVVKKADVTRRRPSPCRAFIPDNLLAVEALALATLLQGPPQVVQLLSMMRLPDDGVEENMARADALKSLARVGLHKTTFGFHLKSILSLGTRPGFTGLRSLQLSLFSSYNSQRDRVAVTKLVPSLLRVISPSIEHLHLAFCIPSPAGAVNECIWCQHIFPDRPTFSSILGKCVFAKLRKLILQNVDAKTLELGRFLKAHQSFLKHISLIHHSCKRDIITMPLIRELAHACGPLLDRIVLDHRSVAVTSPGVEEDELSHMFLESTRAWTLNAAAIAQAYDQNMTKNAILHAVAYTQDVAPETGILSFVSEDDRFVREKSPVDWRRGKIRASILEQYCGLYGACGHEVPFNDGMPCAGFEQATFEHQSLLYVFVVNGRPGVYRRCAATEQMTFEEFDFQHYLPGVPPDNAAFWIYTQSSKFLSKSLARWTSGGRIRGPNYRRENRCHVQLRIDDGFVNIFEFQTADSKQQTWWTWEDDIGLEALMAD